MRWVCATIVEVRHIVLSRKGFDSGAGGGPSPVLPDGTMLSLPIPEPATKCPSPTRYDGIICPGWGSFGDVMRKLGIPEHVLRGTAHLDPDINPTARRRQSGWRPAFGQSGSAASHLARQGVRVGDLFVFWGLFRHTEQRGERLMWRGKPFHAAFGWLWVADMVKPGIDALPPWMDDHPHVSVPDRPNNTIYVAGHRRSAGPVRWDERRRLTAPDSTSSRWLLPGDCHPERTGVDLSYHTDRQRWTLSGKQVALRCVARGQEFVVPAHPAWRKCVVGFVPEAFHAM